MRQLQSILTICALCFGQQFSLAEEHATSESIEDKVESVIVTATRKEQTRSWHPEIFVLDSKFIEFVEPQHIQELLVSTPGVNVQRGNGQEYLPSIRSPVFTGAGSCGAILTAEDGIALRSAGFCNVNELFEAHTEAAQQIEVVRGSGTALYGSNALHGMINVITPEPDDAKQAISLEFGSDDYSRVKIASPLGSQENVAAFLTLATDGGFREESGYDQQKLTVKYTKAFANKKVSAGISATNLNQETAGFITGLDAYKDQTLLRSNPTPEAYRDARSIRAWMRYDHELSGRSSFTITPYIRDTDMQFLQHFLPGDPLEENGQSSFGFQSGYYFNPNGKLQLISGIDLETTDAFLKQSQDLPTQGSVFLVETIPAGQHYDYEVDANTLAGFVYSDWLLKPNWNLSSGLRYEHITYEYDNKMLTGRTRDDGSECGFGGCRYSRPADSKDSFDNLSSHLSLAWKFSPHWNSYLKLSNAYRVPQASELYRLQREQSQADLESESLRGFELGAGYSNDRLSFDTSIYSQKKKNHIFRDSDFFNVSNGETSHQGMELTMNYQITDAFSVSLNSNFAKHRYDYDQVLNGININGNSIDTAPEKFGSLSLDWAITPSLDSQLEILHQGEYFLDPENLNKYNGHNLLNSRTQWQVATEWSLSMRINNLLDTRYAERADYTGFTGERYFPGRERSLFFSIEKTF